MKNVSVSDDGFIEIRLADRIVSVGHAGMIVVEFLDDQGSRTDGGKTWDIWPTKTDIKFN